MVLVSLQWSAAAAVVAAVVVLPQTSNSSDGSCPSADLEPFCGSARRASAGNCLVCVGAHPQFSGCEGAVVDAFCSGEKAELQSSGWGEWLNGGVPFAAFQAQLFQSRAGFSYYTGIFNWFQEGHPLDLRVGTGSVWFRRAMTGGHDPTSSCACDSCDRCAAGMLQAKADNTSCAYEFQSIEGGPGYWSTGGQSLPTSKLKWRVGDSVGCYQAYTGSPLFQFGHYGGHTCSPEEGGMAMGFVALSNRLAMFADGVTFAREGMLGVGYLRTPLGKTSQADTRNFITVVLDSSTFSGPVGYFLPEFWKRRPRGLEAATAAFEDFGTCPNINVTGGAFEIKSVPYLNMSGNAGLRLPYMAVSHCRHHRALFSFGRTPATTC